MASSHIQTTTGWAARFELTIRESPRVEWSRVQAGRVLGLFSLSVSAWEFKWDESSGNETCKLNSHTTGPAMWPQVLDITYTQGGSINKLNWFALPQSINNFCCPNLLLLLLLLLVFVGSYLRARGVAVTRRWLSLVVSYFMEPQQVAVDGPSSSPAQPHRHRLIPALNWMAILNPPGSQANHIQLIAGCRVVKVKEPRRWPTPLRGWTITRHTIQLWNLLQTTARLYLWAQLMGALFLVLSRIEANLVVYSSSLYPFKSIRSIFCFSSNTRTAPIMMMMMTTTTTATILSGEPNLAAFLSIEANIVVPGAH